MLFARAPSAGADADRGIVDACKEFMLHAKCEGMEVFGDIRMVVPYDGVVKEPGQSGFEQEGIRPNIETLCGEGVMKVLAINPNLSVAMDSAIRAAAGTAARKCRGSLYVVSP